MYKQLNQKNSDLHTLPMQYANHIGMAATARTQAQLQPPSSSRQHGAVFSTTLQVYSF